MRRSPTISITAVLIALLATSLFPAPATASTTHDLKGRWTCCGPGGAGAQDWDITSTSLGSGNFSGTGYYPGTNNPFSPISGNVNGASVSLTTGPYIGSSYSATFTGTISADDKTMSGSWTSNAGQNGTWTATRTSGGGAAETAPTPLLSGPKKQKAKPKIGIVIACGIDACIGEVDGVITVFPAGGPKDRAVASSSPKKKFKLKSKSVQVPASSEKTVKLKLGHKALKAARKSLNGGGRAVVKFTVNLGTTADGPTATAHRTVKLTG